MFKTPPHDRLMPLKTREKLSERLDCASGHVLAADRDRKEQSVCASAVISSQTQWQQEMSVLKVPTQSKSELKYENVAAASASSVSTPSSLVRCKKLELEAAEAKAKIQLQLIEKKLEYELAVDDYETDVHGRCASKCPSKASGHHTRSNRSIVNGWMEQNEVQQSPRPEAAAAATTKAARIPSIDPFRAQAQGPPVDSILQLAHTSNDIMVTSSTQHEERLLTHHIIYTARVT